MELKTICKYSVCNIVLTGIVGDITSIDVDAIVNPANSYMLMGGGLAGVLKRRGGKSIEDEARKYAPVPVGEAVVTSAGSLKAKYIIHAPTMKEPGGPTSPDHVYKATYAALSKACEKSIKKIAIPGMGTGVGGLEPLVAVEVMVKAIIDCLKCIEECGVNEVIVIDIREDIPRIFCELLEKHEGVVRIES
ncbi:MAG: O-acetyl-ADP-ribose deacetylase [Desulfurococcales archaeon ex4484_58]|nr:MAG: O-acetyl-ADP-ribose deacetylase [Desulfurococcales archaeon ex4484_58]